MKLSDFHYDLPENLIAQEPLQDRSSSRMLVVYREQQRWEDRLFREFPSFLRPGDCLTVNNSRVLPSRLFGSKESISGNPSRSGNQASPAKVEVLLLEPISQDAREWTALVRPGKKLPVGEVIHFSPDLSAEILARGERGERTLRFSDQDVYAALERLGHMPLPPYIKREDTKSDRERYQTVYAHERGSVAAPTAGLHFTAEVLEQCRNAGAEFARITLHVGLGTFQPLIVEELEGQKLHRERYHVEPEEWGKIEGARRVVAVGSTSVRTIESVARRGELTGATDLFIQPGFPFQRTGAMLTNFHLPQTSLVVLVSAFAGKDLTLAAYRHAVEQRYRFFSYGDCMLIV